MLLDDKDFRDEHEYHAQKRRLLNRMLHGSGVVCGLLFPADKNNVGEKTITISCGLALDCSGYEIYIPCDVTVAIPVPGKEASDPCAKKDDGKEVCYRIRIAYTEEDTDFEQVHLPGGGCDDKTCKATHKREGFCIKFIECECPEQRKPADCKDLIAGFDNPIACGCGCGCSCGVEHWVSLGTVKVTAKGKIVEKPTYQCREYVFSGQMLKQLFTQVPPPTGDCACPDQLERIKELLSLICKTLQTNDTVEKNVTQLKREVDTRNKQIERNLNKKLDDHIAEVKKMIGSKT
jgi:hypothetical protein